MGWIEDESGGLVSPDLADVFERGGALEGLQSASIIVDVNEVAQALAKDIEAILPGPHVEEVCGRPRKGSVNDRALPIENCTNVGHLTCC